MTKTKWNSETVKAYETGQGVELVNDPYPHYVPKTLEHKEEGMTKGEEHMTPNTIEFRSKSDKAWVMRITSDRKIEVNEDVDVTFAAQKVLDAMQGLLTPQHTWGELTDNEILSISNENYIKNKGSRIEFARSILRKAQEK